MTDETNPKDAIASNKTPLHLIPSSASHHMAWAMADGAEKYGPYNWRATKVRATVYLAACRRHIDAYLDGESDAVDSGCHHLGHAMASLSIILDALETGQLIDDRPTPGCAAKLHVRPPPKWASSMVARKVHCYISGPMTGIPNFNFAEFDRASKLVDYLGMVPISPADIDRENGVDENTDPSEVTGHAMKRTFAKRDLDAILDLRVEHEDCLLMLAGWENSKGAVAEKKVAEWLGLKIMYAEEMM